MSKTNIKCPRCNSDKLYKFGMNKQAKQKYQCKQCKRQFAIGDGDGRPKLNSPKCPRCGKGTYFITDRLPSYNEAAATVLPNTEHLPVALMSSDVNNNLIESFNKTFKAWYKAKKGFNSFDKANNLIYLFIFHYNFIRPHGSLNNCTPAEVAGSASDSFAKNSWFSAA